MIERIIEFSIRNRFLVIACALAVIAWGVYSLINTPVDAIPDLSENQVIVFTDWLGRSPREIEDQITYPLSVNLQGLAGVKTVRSSSEFNFSMINIIFEEDVDFYFARERVLERLTLASTFLPPGVVPYLAPDATALGQIFWYTVEGDGYDLGRLRAIQDWYVRYQLNSVPGVAQVASVGGYPIEYQIDVDPDKLRAYGVTLGDLYAAVARSNSAVGGRVVHKANAEYLVRGVGWIESPADIEEVVVKVDASTGTPVTVANLASVGLGTQFRRSVLEKNGNEVTGGVCMMRYGENPLAVTDAIKRKIEQLQAGLPEGVRIVPFYDRTRLIHGAIHTLTETLLHEMLIASIAILLILTHFRSAFVICLTLPMSALISFIMMRHFGVASNIMSLAGIAISIGILVDQAIVMVENATHHLTAHFGTEKVTGDIRELVIPACRTVGRPIFFSVMIILIAFLPVFALSGQEGRIFRPLAFTKSFAMIGVAVLSITLVPALIPTFIRGRLKSEEQNWIVRTLIEIYKPVLSWAMDWPKTVNWFFVVLLALGWYFYSHMGSDYMPPLDEGTVMDMPITAPRISVAEAADDLKTRDAVLRRFPEVESVVGKAGRAETPTDPSPLDMVETVVNLRPKEHWPKRKLRYDDAIRQTRAVLAALEEQGLMHGPGNEADRGSLVNTSAMNALTRFDAAIREFAYQRYSRFQTELGVELTRDLLAELLRHWRHAGRLLRPVDDDECHTVADELAGEFGPLLAAPASRETVNQFVAQAAEKLDAAGAVENRPELFVLHQHPWAEAAWTLGEVIGLERPTLAGLIVEFLEAQRDARWRKRVKSLDYEIFDEAVVVFNRCAVDELLKPAAAADGSKTQDLKPKTQDPNREIDLAQLNAAFAKWLFLWHKERGDLGVAGGEMDSALPVPGWGNIWTQPIINRIDMLATGVRTPVGILVFGDDPDKIQSVSEQVAEVVKQVPGAAGVVPDQIVGKPYVEVHIDRARAARYGLNVGDVQDVIEIALGGKPITMTVEGRERFPVRIRYARDFREDEEQIKELLISTSAAGMAASASDADRMPSESSAPSAAQPRPPQVPLAAVADVRIVEGPSVIKSENGLLRAYVQVSTRDRDVVGFVDEARRAVARKVKLPRGMYLGWSGQFEHAVRARRTLMVVGPAVVLLIFIILYLTYNDFMDAVLMMMAVPEALVGGIFFLWLTGNKLTVAGSVGFIACFGMATETGIIMLVYLREAIEKRGGLEKIASLEELRRTVIEGAVHRLRPKLLTEGVAIVALAPMLWSSGVGHEIIAAMAAPVLGGLLVSDEVVDIFIPVRFYWVRRARWLKLHAATAILLNQPESS